MKRFLSWIALAVMVHILWVLQKKIVQIAWLLLDRALARSVISFLLCLILALFIAFAFGFPAVTKLLSYATVLTVSIYPTSGKRFTVISLIWIVLCILDSVTTGFVSSSNSETFMNIVADILMIIACVKLYLCIGPALDYQDR